MDCAKRLLSALVVCVLTVAAGNCIAREYKFNVFEPPRSALNRFIVEPFIKDVAARTKGQISFRLFPGGSLLGARDTLGGLRDGLIDAGFIVPAFVVSSLPHVNLLPDLLSFIDNPVEELGAQNETMVLDCPECVADYRKMNAIALGGQAAWPYALQCNKPEETMSDLKGLKIRVAGASSGRWVKALGATPVSMPPNQIVEGMQRGQLDCAIANKRWLFDFSLQDAVKGIIDQPMGTYNGLSVFTFNLKTWNSFTHDQRGVILRAIPRALTNGLVEGVYKEELADVKAAVAKRHIKVVKPGPAMRAAWKKFKAGEFQAVIEGAVKRGIKKDVAERIVRAHLANIAKWRKLAAKLGTNRAKIEAALWDNIYSKVKY